MTAAICRLAAALLFASVFLAAAPTRADTGDVPASISWQQRFDVPVAHALDMFFSAADTETVTMRGMGHIRHIIDLAAIRVWPTPRLALRMGVGVASLVDSVVACPAKTSGQALAGSLYYAVLQPRGLSLGIELSTLQVRYDNGASLNEGTVMLALSTR